jgi:uncharacterized protein (TIGR02284 family)
MAATQTGPLNSLLRGEISATETYNQALEKFAGKPAEAELRRLRDEHSEAANSLRQHIHLHGGDPSTGSGAWGTWAKLVEGTAKVFGDTAALKALKEGEEHGVNSYQSALRGNDLTADCKGLISAQLLPRTQAHIPVLDRLMGAQSRS